MRSIRPLVPGAYQSPVALRRLELRLTGSAPPAAAPASRSRLPFSSYGEGGFVYGGVSGGYSNFSNTRTGWTASGGVERMFMRSWSAKAGYLYRILPAAVRPAPLASTPAIIAIRGSTSGALPRL